MQIRGGAGEIIVHRRKIDPNFFFRQEIHGSIEQAAVEQIPFEIGINAVPWKKKKRKERRGTERNPRFRGTGISIGTSARQELSNLTRSPFARYL